MKSRREVKREKLNERAISGSWARAVCCSVLQRIAICCSVLQCVEVCYSHVGFVSANKAPLQQEQALL